MARLLFLSGSTRAGSINVKLQNAAASYAKSQGFDTTEISLKDYPLAIYDGDDEAANGLPDAAQALSDVFVAHHGIFIASPEYNAGVTPLLKNAIDWLSRIPGPSGPPAFADKIFAIGAASPGGFAGVRASLMLRHTLTTGLGQIVLGKQALLPGAGDAFEEDGSLKEGRSRDMMEATVSELHKVATALHG
ncbi:MAG: NAD(P)H-dependent oxidoreductase [Pseudomonadota bacterium]